MNGGQGQGQAAVGQPGQLGPQIHMFKPNQMRGLPEPFTAAEKSKWEQGLTALWGQIEKFPADTTQHQDARRKLYEFSKTLGQKLRDNQAVKMRAANAPGQSQGQGDVTTRPPSQGQPQGITPNGGTDGQMRPNGRMIPPKILEHVASFNMVAPHNMLPGSEEATKWIKIMREKYQMALASMEGSTEKISSIRMSEDKMKAEGKLTPEYEKTLAEQKAKFLKSHGEAKSWVDKLRQQQQELQRQNASLNGNNANTSANASGNSAVLTPVRPPLNVQQNANPTLQTTQAVHAAIENARIQQNNGGRPPQQGVQGATPTQANLNPPQMPQHQGGQVQAIKQEAGVPQINTQMQSRPMQNSNSPQSAVPQSAHSVAPQSATGAPQIARALTHPQALQNAARTYSSGQTLGTPVMGQQPHSHVQGSGTPRETANAMNKMPISKSLSENARQIPQPVGMAPARPTYSGGPNQAGTGVIGQPVFQKQANPNMEGDVDRVLAKKKLDELVKQVTGGGDGLSGGEGLTPEVEESILNVADTFVDQVLQAACNNAKERGSTVLEIRDIQLTLERGYNIRIPGYASDEIRTVRKILPAPAWINKMSAVQAAKVTGGRGD
ncbi:transcription initiation factor TFIID subunit A-domain-containing protein, partial [Calycina marina]